MERKICRPTGGGNRPGQITHRRPSESMERLEGDNLLEEEALLRNMITRLEGRTAGVRQLARRMG